QAGQREQTATTQALLDLAIEGLEHRSNLLAGQFSVLGDLSHDFRLRRCATFLCHQSTPHEKNSRRKKCSAACDSARNISHEFPHANHFSLHSDAANALFSRVRRTCATTRVSP